MIIVSFSINLITNLQKLSDLPTVDELSSAGLIDSGNIDSSIFGTGKFFKEKQEVKAGQLIAEMGSSDAKMTGLRFEIRYRGKSVNPVKYLP